MRTARRFALTTAAAALALTAAVPAASADTSPQGSVDASVLEAPANGSIQVALAAAHSVGDPDTGSTVVDELRTFLGTTVLLSSAPALSVACSLHPATCT